jgi:predicted PurR-regulated permease PerM
MNEHRKRPQRKGVVGYFLVFVMLSVVLLFLFGAATPMLIDISGRFFQAGDSILAMNTDWINNIQNATLKAEIQNTLNSAQEASADNINILGFFYQYAWLVIIIVTLFVIFMATRLTVETERII